MIPRPCAVPACPKTTDATHCADHARTDYNRPNSTRRGYDRRWRKFRRTVIRERGYRCERCADRPLDTAKLHLHHIDGLGPLGPRGYDRGNLELLCEPCHNAEPAASEAISFRPPPGVDRCAVGVPRVRFPSPISARWDFS